MDTKSKRDRSLLIIIIAVASTVIIGDLGMHFLFGPKDTPPNTAVAIIDKLESKKMDTSEIGKLIIQNDTSSADIMRPGGWSGKFANYTIL